MKTGKPGNIDEKGQRIAWLVAGFIRHTLTEKEHDELDNWINESDENMILFEEWTDDDNIQANLEWMDQVNSEGSFRQLQERGAFDSPGKKWFWAIAGSLILILGALLIYFDIKIPGRTLPIAVVDSIVPGGNKATLQFGNGEVIDLENSAVGKLHRGAQKIQDGALEYAEHVEVRERHILRTPLGGQYVVQLNDGTKVWLNASSMLTYPTEFEDSIRQVELTGEAYFEVAKSSKPFIVRLNSKTSIRVLGTHFNINTYTNEPGYSITLLEGKVEVDLDAHRIQLAAGEQAFIRKDTIDRTLATDVDEIVGWKNGSFIFRQAHIETIMRQLERWYGTTTVYKGKPSDAFTATIERKESVKKLLHLLEQTGRVHFEIVNKTIYVLP